MSLDHQATEELLKTVKIPPIPYVLKQLNAELQKDEPELNDIAKLIAKDIALSGLVLRTINSPFFNLRSKVESIQHATGLLGLNNTINIVVGLAFRKTMEEAPGETPPHYWESPGNVAMVSAFLAKKLTAIPSDEAYMLGLFHDAGIALFMQNFDDYGQFLQEYGNHPDTDIVEFENKKYKTNHAVMGYFMGASWALDKTMLNVVREHHNAVEVLRQDTEQSSKEALMLAILKMAEHIDAVYWETDPHNEWLRIKDTVLDYIGISEPDFNDLRDDMLELLRYG